MNLIAPNCAASLRRKQKLGPRKSVLMSAVLGMLALSLCSGLTAAWFGNRGGEADHAQKPPAPAATNGLTIPKDHPRIWWAPARLEQGSRWPAENSRRPR